MSTSTIPSRTRSLRKPNDINTNTSTTRYGRSIAPTSSIEQNQAPANLNRQSTSIPTRGSVSPSRLPVKPLTRSATASTRPPSANGSTVSDRSMRPPSSRISSKLPTTEASTIQRPTSTRRASDASQSSTSSSLQRSTSTRRPSTSSKTAPTITTADPVKQDRSRPPLTQYKHLRNASTSSTQTSSSTTSTVPPRTHSRTTSTSTIVSNSPSQLRPPSREATTSSNPSQTQLLQRKAQFSTYNQHFSPQKSHAPKPASSTFLVPPTPSKHPSNIAKTAETSKLQNELLQLHLLHASSFDVKKQWQESAHRILQSRFEHLKRRDGELRGREEEEMGRRCGEEFKAWGSDGVAVGIGEKVRVLSEVLSGVWSLGEDRGGRFSGVVRSFERLLVRNQEIHDMRESGESDDVDFIQGLPTEWKEEVFQIERKLQAWKNDMSYLGLPNPHNHAEKTVAIPSTLTLVIEKLTETIDGMLEELYAMRDLEDEIVRREEEWIERMNRDDDDDEEEHGSSVAGAIWRRV